MRQWEILKLIPSRGVGITAGELTETLLELGFKVSKRTIERDLQDLSTSFGLICNDKARPYGWRWPDGVGHPFPALTVAEAVSINIVERLARHLLPQAVLQVLEPQFRKACKKLESLGAANNLTSWRDKIRVRPPGLPLLPPIINRDIQETIQNAVLNECQLQADYQAAGSTESRLLVLHPLGMVQRGLVTYLLATAFEYDDVRLYAMHRFKGAEILMEPANMLRGFSIDQYIEDGALEFGKGKKIQLKAWIHEDMASFLSETPLSEDMKITGQEERLEVTASVADTWQLRWWILSQGPRIEVRAPVSLRKEIVEEVEALHRLYQFCE